MQTKIQTKDINNIESGYNNFYLDGHKVLHGLSCIPTAQHCPQLGEAPTCVKAEIDVLYGYPVFGDMSITARLTDGGVIDGTEGHDELDNLIRILAVLGGYTVAEK